MTANVSLMGVFLLRWVSASLGGGDISKAKVPTRYSQRQCAHFLEQAQITHEAGMSIDEATIRARQRAIYLTIHPDKIGVGTYLAFPIW